MPQRAEVRRKTTRPYRPWAPQVSLLRYLVKRGDTAPQIADRLQRQKAAVFLKCRALDLELQSGQIGRPRKDG